MVESILKFTHSKFARGLVGGVSGALIFTTVVHTIILFFEWLAMKNGIEQPAGAATMRAAVLGLIAAWAIFSVIEAVVLGLMISICIAPSFLPTPRPPDRRP